MADKSAIEWTDATWNPVTGCSKVSPGCAHCYAETLALTRLAGKTGYPGLPWTPENAAANVIPRRPVRSDDPLTFLQGECKVHCGTVRYTVGNDLEGDRMDEYGDRADIAELLRSKGWEVPGVFAGGCVSRGVGSSFRALAHTHTQTEPLGWICVRSPKRLLTPTGEPSRILRHEVAHVLAPKTTHGTPAFRKALASVGIRSDSYSRAGRNRIAAGSRT